MEPGCGRGPSWLDKCGDEHAFHECQIAPACSWMGCTVCGPPDGCSWAVSPGAFTNLKPVSRSCLYSLIPCRRVLRSFCTVVATRLTQHQVQSLHWRSSAYYHLGMEHEASSYPSSYWEVYALTSKAVARSIAACLPLNALQNMQAIAVKVKVQQKPNLLTTVAGTIVVKHAIYGAGPAECSVLQHLM